MTNPLPGAWYLVPDWSTAHFFRYDERGAMQNLSLCCRRPHDSPRPVGDLAVDHCKQCEASKSYRERGGTRLNPKRRAGQ